MKLLLTWFLLIVSVVIPLQAEKWALLVGIKTIPMILTHYDIVWLM